MARFISGEVVVVPFPFTDLDQLQSPTGCGVGVVESWRCDPLPDHQPGRRRPCRFWRRILSPEAVFAVPASPCPTELSLPTKSAYDGQWED